MPVPPGSIHLHTHSPSVLTSPSGSRQQAGSGSLRARSWCWTLSGRKHFPANSFTWKELLAGLTTCLFKPQSPPSPGERLHTAKHEFTLASKPRAVQHCVATTSNWETRHGLPKQAQQSQDDLTVLISEQASTHRLAQLFPNTRILPLEFNTGNSGSGMRFTGFTQNQTQTHSSGQGVHVFLRHNTGLTVSEMNQGILQRSYRFHAQRFGSEWRKIPHPRFSSALIFACTRVDTCHPGNCMCSIRTPFLPPLGKSRVLPKDLG
jgi:hypothetical protein